MHLTERRNERTDSAQAHAPVRAHAAPEHPLGKASERPLGKASERPLGGIPERPLGDAPEGPHRVRAAAAPFIVAAVLLAVVVAAAALRFTGINWDRFQHLHPDERFIVWVADTMKWPADAPGGFVGQLRVALDPTVSPLNPFRWPRGNGELAGKPRNYAYGHLPLYLLVGVAHAAAAIGDWFGRTTLAFPAWMQPLNTVGRHLAEYNYLALVGRALSALADLGTLGIVYALGVRVGRRMRRPTEDAEAAASAGAARTSPSVPRTPASDASGVSVAHLVGFLAAGFYAFAVLPIQLSHFAAVDALLTFFIVATVALAARFAERGGRWTLALAGVTAGLAVGSKFSAVMLALPLLAATLYRLPTGDLWTKALVVARRALPVALVAFLTFVLTNPFALLELNQYIAQISAQNQMVSGVMDAPYTRQYIGTLPYVYFVQQLSQWGLGWPAGIVAWAGLVWALVRFGLGRASPAMSVLLAWAFPYFIVTGIFHTKFLRYMAPLLPFLLVFGAAAALAGRRWLAARVGRPGRFAWTALAVAAAAFTVLWAIAFGSIYGQEHPWIAASKWIYRNVPEGARVLSEAWDDALPLTMDELIDRPPLRKYDRAELPMWDADTPAKVDQLAESLARADYLAIASNRVYAPVARLAARYPMTSAYYRQLFAGDLGYTRVADFSAYPRLGSWPIRDDHADESFSVYDHPRAFIFQNTGRLSSAELAARLRPALGAAASQAAPFAPSGVSTAGAGETTLAQQTQPGGATGVGAHPGGTHPGGLRAPGRNLSSQASQPARALPDIIDYRWNPVASASPILAAVLWWLVITVFGWFAWPLLFPFARGLADRGHGIARVLGWLLLGWVHWMGVSLGLWRNALGPLLLILLAFVLAGRLAWAGQRRELAAFWRSRKRLILGQEALFAGAFLLFVGVRLLNPDLWQPWNGGEKFMEFAFLNATLRSPTFPPYDPYFAGGTINYYYFGLYLVSLPIRLTGIHAEVAFNLAIPTLFALTASGVFTVAYSLAHAGASSVGSPADPARGPHSLRRPALVASLSVVLTLLAGNLTGISWAVKALAQVFQGRGLPAFDYWAASRVIPFTINEFPLWTFTFADLHPHLIAMAFGMLVAGLALNWLRRPPAGLAASLVQLLLLALTLGALGAINTWDLPTYALLVAGALLVAAWRAPRPLRPRLVALIGTGLSASGVVALAVALYLPFYEHYEARVGGDGGAVGRFLGLVKEPSPFLPWLLIWGLFLFLALSYTLVELLGRRVASEVAAAPAARTSPSHTSDAAPRAARGWLFGVLLVVAVLAILAAAGWPTVALASLPLMLSLPLVLNRRVPGDAAAAGRAFVGLLLVLGLGVVVGIEIVYLRDFLEGGDWHRMNTLFKFSVPAWLFLGLAGGYILARLWSLTNRAPAWLGISWQVAAGLLIAGSLVFLVAGVRDRVLDRFPGRRPPIGTLDGMAYMRVGEYTWPGPDDRITLASDYEAIQWLLANVRGAPVVAEAPAGSYTVHGQEVGFDYYRAGGLRVASMTGLPTFVGQHQYEQRAADQVARQTAEGMDFFRTTDLSVARRLLAQHHVRYVYIGQLERLLFSADALRKFDILVEAGELRVVFRNAGVVIYESAAN